ncbi:MAG: transcription antitermination factor NusB [Pseudomonadota bacterium]
MSGTDQIRRLKPAERAAQRKSAARLNAVQALYQLDVGGGGIETVIDEFHHHRIGALVEGEQYPDADIAYFDRLVRGVADEQVRIDRAMETCLKDGWSIVRLDRALRALLRCALYEMLCEAAVPTAVIIDEYMHVAHAFFSGDEPALVNGILDRAARDFRSETA